MLAQILFGFLPLHRLPLESHLPPMHLNQVSVGRRRP